MCIEGGAEEESHLVTENRKSRRRVLCTHDKKHKEELNFFPISLSYFQQTLCGKKNCNSHAFKILFVHQKNSFSIDEAKGHDIKNDLVEIEILLHQFCFSFPKMSLDNDASR